ncbi:Protein transport protein S9 plasma membrane t-SNARE [Gryganskiella cystojenkinii]|nr:Protein transport protein S9 plasma membrane t-SNARE [Gryganskiella cystojenkinii]
MAAYGGNTRQYGGGGTYSNNRYGSSSSSNSDGQSSTSSYTPTTSFGRPTTSGGGDGGGAQSYRQSSLSSYGQYQKFRQQDQYAPQDQQRPFNEDDVARVQQETRDLRLESLQSTEESLRLMRESNQSADRTMTQLGEQSETLGRVERLLDSGQIHADAAVEKTRELKTVNRSMFAFHIKTPFSSSRQKKERALEEAKEKAAEEAAQRERVRKEEAESRQRLEVGQGQGPYGRDRGQPYRQQSGERREEGDGGPGGERSLYSFENSTEDDAVEEKIDQNLNLLGGGLAELKAKTEAMRTEVLQQTERMNGLSTKTDELSGTIKHNNNMLQKIARS